MCIWSSTWVYYCMQSKGGGGWDSGTSRCPQMFTWAITKISTFHPLGAHKLAIKLQALRSQVQYFYHWPPPRHQSDQYNWVSAASAGIVWTAHQARTPGLVSTLQANAWHSHCTLHSSGIYMMSSINLAKHRPLEGKDVICLTEREWSTSLDTWTWSMTKLPCMYNH